MTANEAWKEMIVPQTPNLQTLFGRNKRQAPQCNCGPQSQNCPAGKSFFQKIIHQFAILGPPGPVRSDRLFPDLLKIIPFFISARTEGRRWRTCKNFLIFWFKTRPFSRVRQVRMEFQEARESESPPTLDQEAASLVRWVRSRKFSRWNLLNAFFSGPPGP